MTPKVYLFKFKCKSSVPYKDFAALIVSNFVEVVSFNTIATSPCIASKSYTYPNCADVLEQDYVSYI